MAKTSQLFYTFLITISISYSFCAQTDKYIEDENQSQNPIKQALAVLDMITRFNEFKGRALGSFPDPVNALAELTLFGAFKLAFGIIAGLLAIGAVFPSMLAIAGISGPFLIRSVAENIGDLSHLDYETVVRSIRSLPEKSFEALDVRGEACRSRAVCEIGQYSAKVFPTAAGYVRAFGNKLNFSEKYLSAVIKGMTKANCANAYRTCSESPFKKLSYLSTYNIF